MKVRNSRNAGNGYERMIVKELKKFGYDVGTSRNESRSMDAQKVDIVSIGENQLPFHIQCKYSKNKPNYHEIISSMPVDKIPVIFHRQCHKVNTRFVTDGDYVIMKKEDFYKLIEQ